MKEPLKKRKIVTVIMMTLVVMCLFVSIANAGTVRSRFNWEMNFGSEYDWKNYKCGTTTDLYLNTAGWLVNTGGHVESYSIAWKSGSLTTSPYRLANNLYYQNKFATVKVGTHRATLHKTGGEDGSHMKGLCAVVWD